MGIVTNYLCEGIQEMGGKIQTNHKVTTIKYKPRLNNETSKSD